ncbi:hypothetical protein D9613_012876 [Agrocybe pediades]|uniref:Uncharacterized protein n=1 Tax=Agrocybe pediades TaxID=84607 RepID=A0A8H4QW95_9AGAR|nr:hypothetical protein D9613_012876 [Agrocybe pediades]
MTQVEPPAALDCPFLYHHHHHQFTPAMAIFIPPGPTTTTTIFLTTANPYATPTFVERPAPHHYTIALFTTTTAVLSLPPPRPAHSQRIHNARSTPPHLSVDDDDETTIPASPLPSVHYRAVSIITTAVAVVFAIRWHHPSPKHTNTPPPRFLSVDNSTIPPIPPHRRHKPSRQPLPLPPPLPSDVNDETNRQRERRVTREGSWPAPPCSLGKDVEQEARGGRVEEEMRQATRGE